MRSTPGGEKVTNRYVEHVEVGRARKRGRRVRGFRYGVEVRQIQPSAPGADSYAAKAVDVLRLWGEVPCSVLHDFREWTGKTGEEADDKARAEVKGWIADGAPGSD